MKDLVKKLIVGTPLEPAARRLYAALISRAQPAPQEPVAAAEPAPAPIPEPASDASATPEAEDRNRQYDLQTLEVMRRTLREDSNCIDVGCHRGSILQDMLRLAPRGTHFAFEPIPDLYAELERSLGEQANVRLHQVALSDTRGTVSFQHVVSNPGYSGLRKRRYDRPGEELQEIEVRTERLDDILPAGVPIHFVKVDVEGAELQVFRGAVETLRRCRPVIVFEHGLGAADYYGTRPEGVHDLLGGQCGLKLSVMADWLADPEDSALDRAEFARRFTSGEEYYFMAHP